MWLSTLEIGAAKLRSVTEIAPKSPFYVNRSPIQYGFRAGDKAFRLGLVWAGELKGNKTKKKSHWASGINNSFLLLYCTQPRSQVWIFLIMWNWPIKTIFSFKVVGVHFTKQISVTLCSYLHLLHFSAFRARAWAWTRNGWISRYSLVVVLCKWYRPPLTRTHFAYTDLDISINKP